VTIAFRETPVPPSPLARWDPRWKLAGIGLFSIGIAFLRTPAATGIALGTGLALVLVSRLPLRQTFARLGLFALAVIPVLIVFPLVSGWGGFVEAVTIALRCLAVGAVGLVLFGTAPVHRTLAALRSLGVPALVVHLFQLTYRYAHLLAAEYRRVRVAMRVRGFRPRATGHHSGETCGVPSCNTGAISETPNLVA
jgi:cobalt/nickel transport system permease protein